MASQKTIGMIGVGRMGHGIAASLLRKGHQVRFLDHPGNQPVDDLLAMGAQRFDNVRAVADSASIVIMCVTGTPAAEEVALRQDGLVSCLKPGQIVLDCTTAMPDSTLRIAEALTKTGARYLDTAMTRTPKEAEEGRLGLIVGGDGALLAEVEPVLRAFAESVVHAGPVSSGHRLKLLHNFVSLGFAALLSEAAACANRSGVEPKVFLDVLAAGAGDGVVFRRLKPFIESGDDSGLRFNITNALKDITYYGEMAGSASARREIAEAVRQSYSIARDNGYAEAFVPQLVKALTLT